MKETILAHTPGILSKFFWASWGLVILSAFFDSYASFIVKNQFNQLGKINYSSWSSLMQYFIAFFKSPLLLSAGATFILAPFLWFLALNRIELSTAYPILIGLHLIFVLLFSTLFLKESFTVHKALGTGFLLASLFLFYQAKGS